MRLYSWLVVGLGVVFIALGVALLVRTAAEGGGVVGFLLGGLFIALGAGRLTLVRTKRRGP